MFQHLRAWHHWIFFKDASGQDLTSPAVFVVTKSRYFLTLGKCVLCLNLTRVKHCRTIKIRTGVLILRVTSTCPWFAEHQLFLVIRCRYTHAICENHIKIARHGFYTATRANSPPHHFDVNIYIDCVSVVNETSQTEKLSIWTKQDRRTESVFSVIALFFPPVKKPNSIYVKQGLKDLGIKAINWLLSDLKPC